MSSVNRVILIGHLGRDPEVRFTPNGAAICNVSIATSRSWKDKTSGEKVEETEWSRVVMYDRLAEIAGEYLKKGRQVYIEGRLKTRKWTDKDGIEKCATEIIAQEMTLLGGREGGEERSPAPAPKPPQRSAAPAPKQGTAFDDMDSDVPF